ncbi:hypothetical protein PB70LOC_02256 [Pectobacterium versatile]|nr:hypothetical protein PB70LOC_02256 [Pectobacterium versatile]POY62116.1 hypothetical protein PB69LOC_02905 [Pectobacterium versatile]
MLHSVATPHPFLETHAYFVVVTSLEALAITRLDRNKP